MPVIPLDEGGAYVAAAYLVFVALVVLYVAIIGSKIARMERDLQTLTELVERPSR